MPRLAHAHAGAPEERRRTTSTSTSAAPAACASATELAGCDGGHGPTSPNPSQWRIEVIKVPLAAPATAAVVNEPRLFANEATGAINGLQNAPQTPNHPSGIAVGPDARHELLPRHHGLREVRHRRRLLRGQRPADRHLRPGEPEAHRRGRRPAVRLLARRDVLQRRQEGLLHRRVGRRHGRALPRDRPAELGRERDLRDRQPQARVHAATTSCPVAQTDHGELRQPPPVAGPDPRPRHLRPGLVPGRRVAGRLHRRRRARRRSATSTAARSARARSCSAASGRPTGTTARSTARRSPAASTSFDLTPTADLTQAEIDFAKRDGQGRALQRAEPGPSSPGAAPR